MLTLAAVFATVVVSSSSPCILVHSFSIQPSTHVTKRSSSRLKSSSNPFNYGREVPRENIRLPLLVDTGNADDNDDTLRWNVPLPNAHLPCVEFTTASLYELQLEAPVHKMVIHDAISSSDLANPSPILYGHVVWTDSDSTNLVGAIGCAGEILIGAPSSVIDSDNIVGDEGEILERIMVDGEEDEGPLTVLARGSYRFRVKEVIKSIPFPIAIVDELLDEDVQQHTDKIDEENNNDTQDKEDDDDIYDSLSPTELIQQVLQNLNAILTAQHEAAKTPLSPLEKSILENASSSAPMAQAIHRRFDAEERLAVFQTFTSSLLDIAPDLRDRQYAVALMAGELANFRSELRAKMLKTVDGVARLRMVLRELSSMVSMESAQRLAKSISLESEVASKLDDDEYSDFADFESTTIGTDTESLQVAEESMKECKVGTPQLPPWANQIKNGVRVEYFWNEVEGWCAGTVVEDPIKVIDEIIISVKFDDDGSIHKLPLRGEDKARWRPAVG